MTLGLGLTFLYLPIALVILYSFNASRLVTVWGGFSTHWYATLLQNEQLLRSAWTSLEIAFVSGFLAAWLGTCAALALTHRISFSGRTLFAAMIYAPLVMPEAIMGLALLLMFVAFDLERGFWTVVIAHTTLTLCFVTVIVQARLSEIDPSLQEAAKDLGAGPAAVFFTVTLPLIWPAVLAGFLLAATISLDDLVIASFTSGPASTTLPMRLYSQVRIGVTPEINALSSLMIGAVALALILVAVLQRRSKAL
jgi:putrescine transport system permease protein